MKRSRKLIAFLGVLALVLGITTPAQAYYNYGTVGISAGSSSLSVTAGQTVQTSVALNPASDSQTLGCGMAQCPQVCDSGAVLAQGYSCFDSNGNCTCAGSSYSTYYTEVSASSSNSGVASAYVSGNTLVVTGKSAGTATITLTASLRQWSSSSCTVTVNVAAAPQTSSGGGSSAGSGSSSTSSGSGASSSSNKNTSTGSSSSSNKNTSSGTSSSSNQNTSSGSTSSSNKNTSTGSGSSSSSSKNMSSSLGSVSSSGASAANTVQQNAVVTSAGIPEEAKPTESVDDQLNETVVETVAGKVYTIEINDYLDVADALGQVAETGDEVVFWSGDSSTAPKYSWTISGKDLAKDAAAAFDPRIEISDLGTGDVANIMKQASDGVVLDFAHAGALPAKSLLYVAVPDYANGTKLTLFTYDTDARAFVKAAEGLEVVDGFVSFDIDHCSTWALSTDDLASYTVQEANTPGATRAAAAEKTDEAEAETSDPTAIVVAAVLVVAAVAWFLRRRKSSASAAEPAPVTGSEPMAESEPASAAEPAPEPESEPEATTPETESEASKDDPSQS